MRSRNVFRFRAATSCLALVAMACAATMPLAASPAGAATPAPNWMRLSPAKSPPPRLNGSMAYDPATGQLVLFGGAKAKALNDTWVWNGRTWTQLSPKSRPSPRFGAALAYDAATKQLLLFGGQTNALIYNDTWEWTGSTWRKLSPSRHPTARSDERDRL